ncbi:MAG: YraN family protein [Candidatus Magasanikiibacteriota bacterium]
MVKTAKQKLGEWGEEQTCSFLVRQCYKIVMRNYRVDLDWVKGEIDIIAIDPDGVLCFVEVKTRGSGEGSAERATSFEKKVGKIKNVAIQYCVDNNIDVDRTKMKLEHVSVYFSRSEKKVDFKKYVLEVC